MVSPDSSIAFSRFLESEGLGTRRVRIDSKGRISLPSELRKNFGLKEGDEIELVFNLRKNFIILILTNGQDGVKGQDTDGYRSTRDSTADCGSAGPGSIPGPGLKGRDAGEACVN